MKKIQLIAVFALCLSIVTLAGCSTDTNTSTTNDSWNIATTTIVEWDKVIIETDQISYDVPKRHIESIRLKATLNKDTKVIEAIEVENSEGDHESVEYQRAFNEWIQAQVIWKPIDQVSVWTINGASLTSQAFNLAIEQIKIKWLTASVS